MCVNVAACCSAWFVGIALVCFWYLLLLRFLLHSLPFSFTSGEAITVATLAALLFTTASTSAWSQLQPLLPAFLRTAVAPLPAITLDAAHPVSISAEAVASLRFFHACAGLLVGICLLGVLWYWPCLLPYRRAVLPEQRGEAAPAAAQTRARSSWHMPVPLLHVIMLLVIFGVVWPYIWLQMGCEPFTFVLAFIVAAPIPSIGALPRLIGSLPELLASVDAASYASFFESASLQRLHVHAFSSLRFLLASPRLLIIAGWILLMAVGVFFAAPTGTAKPKQAAVGDQSESSQSGSRAPIVSAASAPAASSPAGWLCFRGPIPNIVVRKYYHFLAVLLFLPAILLEPGLVALSFAVALSIFLLLEYIRLARLPPFGSALHQFMQTYLDARDSGLVILTHTYLLVGCALPLWLHLPYLANEKPAILQSALAAHNGMLEAVQASSSGDGPPPLVFDLPLYLPALAGVLMLGIGDSMASLVGVWLGRHRWFGSSRSLEGTAAAVLSICATVFALTQMLHLLNTMFFDSAWIIVDPVSTHKAACTHC